MTHADRLTIAAAQPVCLAYDVGENAVSHADVVLSAAARVVVFPELSLTGYHLDAPTLDPGDGRLRPLIDACEAAASVALVGAPTSDDQGEYISVLAVGADGSGVASAGPDTGRIARAELSRRKATT